MRKNYKGMLLSVAVSAAIANTAYADNLSLDNIFNEAKYDGYVRIGYQNHDVENDKSYEDLSIGGKLHLETGSISGISAGVSFYTTNQIDKNENGGVPFFDSNAKSYSIVGEAYLKGVFKNTTIKIGRQEIDTPFADTDDIGMIPNTFEAGVLVNSDLPDTTIVLAHIQKWAGVDAEKPEEFTRINDDNGVQTLGITYEGIEGLSLSGWYYRLDDFAIENIYYLEAIYGSEIGELSYEIGAQYANQDYNDADEASIYGVSLLLGYKGVTIGAAYNESNDNAADNGFGGGPFFTSAEHLTLAETGVDGEIYSITGEVDLGEVGIEGLSLAAGYFNLEDKDGNEADEIDIGASYAFNDNLSFDLIYSDVDDDINGDEFKNTRVFVNYIF